MDNFGNKIGIKDSNKKKKNFNIFFKFMKLYIDI